MKKTILVVDDYEDTRDFMKIILESYGYLVLEATNGQEAVDIFKEEPLDIILMDVSMPIMDGLTATKIIRESDDIPQIPIIAISALGENVNESVREAGCNQLMSKPIDFGKLETMLEKYLAF